MKFRCFSEKNPHHAQIIWVREIINLVQCVRQRGLDRLRVSFGDSNQLTATLHLGLSNFKLSKNEITGFTLKVPNDTEYTICSARAVEELHSLLSQMN